MHANANITPLPVGAVRQLSQHITSRRRQLVGGRLRWVFTVNVGDTTEETVHDDMMEARRLAFQRIVALLKAQGQPVSHGTIALLAGIYPSAFLGPAREPADGYTPDPHPPAIA